MTTWYQEDADVESVKQTYMLFVACNFPSKSSEYPRIQGISVRTMCVVHVVGNSVLDTTTNSGAREGGR